MSKTESQTYNNVPMSDELAEKVARTDAFWTGPRLVLLCAATLLAAWTVLWLAANGSIGPETPEYENVAHDLGSMP